MIVEPEQRIPDFIKAGADIVSVHAEQSSTIHLHRSINQARPCTMYGEGGRGGAGLIRSHVGHPAHVATTGACSSSRTLSPHRHGLPVRALHTGQRRWTNHR